MQTPDSPLAIVNKDLQFRSRGATETDPRSSEKPTAGLFRQAALYYHTVRYLKPNQIFGRLYAASRKRFAPPRIAKAPANLHGNLDSDLPFLDRDAWNSAEQIRSGCFDFLNRQEQLGWPVDWNASTLPLLWQFNLHYFNYLHLLENDQQMEICRDWMRANPIGCEPAWHPYPTSLRLINWCKANLETPEISQSIYEQAAYLYANLETYHPGNHLLENARALIFAGTYFKEQGDAPLWVEKGLEIFHRESPTQVLSDGGYFERSPMYHSLMLEGYLDIINILHKNPPTRSILIDAVKKMCDFLCSVTHPSGKVALFNDSTEEIAASTARLLDYAQSLIGHTAQKKIAFPVSGYFIHENEDAYLIIDGGPIGPSFLPVHAHADIFSFELSLKALPLIVDSGVYEYQAGAMREYVRSTRAHNTVTIDGRDQAECWDSFRVARRFDPQDVSFTSSDGESRFEGMFDGYAKLIGDQIVHRRRVTCLDSQREIQIEDSISGAGRHLVESMLHLHPSVSVEREGDSIRLRHSAVESVLRVDEGEIAIEDGWCCPRFGVKERNTVVVIKAETKLPVKLSYRIAY